MTLTITLVVVDLKWTPDEEKLSGADFDNVKQLSNVFIWINPINSIR